MPNIYDGELVDVSTRVLDRLPAIAGTSGHAFVAISNGHGAWEMAISNTLSRNDTVLVLESGRFARGWGEMAAASGVTVETLSGNDRGPVEPAAVTDRLRADTAHSIKAVLVVQTDTATSVRNDVAALRRAIDAAEHPALFMVDCIASMGCERYEMDAWGVDVTVAASQKGLMTPPGLGFVWANDKAIAAHQTADLRSGYFDWTARINSHAHYQLYAGTPPTSHLFALHEALDIIDEEGGLEAVWARHRVMAEAVWAAVDAWSSEFGLECNIVDPQHRSYAVTTVRTGVVDADRLREICEDGAGLTVGLGIGDLGPNIRIGHMGHLSPPMLLGTLGTIEAALIAMDAPIGGSGVAAAAASLARPIGGRLVQH